MSKKRKKSGAKMNPTQREAHLTKVGILARQGFSTSEIAERTGVSVSQISKNLVQIRERYLNAQVVEHHMHVEEMKQSYYDVIREAWIAYEESKKPSKRKTVSVDKEGNVLTSLTREKRLPANSYLSTISNAFASLRQLYGLDAPTRSEVTTTSFNFDAFMESIPQGAIPNTVEERINKALESQGIPVLPLPPMEATEATEAMEATEAEEGAKINLSPRVEELQNLSPSVSQGIDKPVEPVSSRQATIEPVSSSQGALAPVSLRQDTIEPVSSRQDTIEPTVELVNKDWLEAMGLEPTVSDGNGE